MPAFSFTYKDRLLTISLEGCGADVAMRAVEAAQEALGGADYRSQESHRRPRSTASFIRQVLADRGEATRRDLIRAADAEGVRGNIGGTLGSLVSNGEIVADGKWGSTIYRLADSDDGLDTTDSRHHHVLREGDF